MTYLLMREMRVWSFGSDRMARTSCQWGVRPLPPETRLICDESVNGGTGIMTSCRTRLVEVEWLSVDFEAAAAFIRDTTRRATNVNFLA